MIVGQHGRRAGVGDRASEHAVEASQFVANLDACGQADPTTVGVTTKPGVPTGIGYSAVVSPLGEIRAQAVDRPELLVVDIDPSEVDDARSKVPVLANARDFS